MLIKYEPFQAKNILHRIQSGYTLNPYRGCSVGCRYCYVQQKKYIDSTGFEEEKDRVVQVKINAPHLLKKKLSAGIEPALITIGESCEPYADIEDEYFITQRLLEILKNYNFPLHIITRFSRVLRDIELIKQIDKRNFACVTISIPIISNGLVAKLEGDSPNIKERLKTIKSLRKNNISAGVAVSPVIPYISDGEETIRVLKKSSENGASYALFNPLVIKEYQRKMIFSWLSEKYPELVEPYERLYKDNQLPENEYWEKFLELAKKKAQDFNLMMGLPLKSGIIQQQELFRFSNGYG